MTSTPTASDAVSKAKKQIMEGLDIHDKRPTSDGKEVESVAQQDVLNQAREAETAAYAQADEATTKVSPQSNSDAKEVMTYLQQNYDLEIQQDEKSLDIKNKLDGLVDKENDFTKEKGAGRYSYEIKDGKRVVFQFTRERGGGDGAAPYVITIIDIQ